MVTSNVVGRDIVGYVDELTLAIGRQLTLPTGYSVEFGGEFENQQRATRNLLLVVPAALLLITIILSPRSVPWGSADPGNIPSPSWAASSRFCHRAVPVGTGLGRFDRAAGVAVLNGVVMVSYFELTRLSERDIARRIIQGSVRRLRPVLMTASTAMFGLLPLAFATGPGRRSRNPWPSWSSAACSVPPSPPCTCCPCSTTTTGEAQPWMTGNY